MNSVILVGRASKDGGEDIKYFESGKVRTSFGLAVNRWSSASKEEVTDWYNIEIWDKQAEIAGEYVKKGKMTAVEGRLTFNKWTSPDGVNHERPIIRVNRLRLLSGKNE